jgi:Protein of unknown function (DUF3106)
MALHLKSLFVSIFGVIMIAGFAGANSEALAQAAPSPAHGKSTALPEKTPDGTWQSLKPIQQQILAPLQSDWDYMPPDSRKKWIQVANIYPKMSEQDQQRLQSRMASWYNLSQKERRIARENYLSSLKFPAEKKAEAWSAYQKLSDEQKKKLAEVEAKKKPKAINAPTLQLHPINSQTTPPPPAPKPRSLPAAEDVQATESSTTN